MLDKFSYKFFTIITIPILFLFLSKIGFYESCFLFDNNDDSNHTFVNIAQSFSAFKNFQLPLINFYNNFGTPLIGDALTYPFSIGVFTYLIDNYPLAMTINRVVIIVLTFYFLNKFFIKKFSLPTSFILSILTIFYPGILWNLAHHHYQFTLFFFVLLLNFCVTDSKSYKLYPYILFIILILFFLSVSIQLVIFSIPFLIIYIYLNKKENLKIFLFSLLFSFIFTLPNHYLFFVYIGESLRLSFSPYIGYITNFRELILSFFVPYFEWSKFGVPGHLGINTYFSISFIVLSSLGLIFLLRNRKKILLEYILLGIVPTICAFIIQFLLFNIPIFKSVDTLRLLWFAYPFLLIPVGIFLDNLEKIKFNDFYFVKLFLLFFIILLVLSISKYIFLEEFYGIGVSHFIELALLLIFFIFFFSKSYFKFCYAILCLCLFFVVIPSIYIILGFHGKSCDIPNHYYNLRSKADIISDSFIPSLEKNSRAAFIEHPIGGNDLKLSYYGILGSASRSIISSSFLRDKFLEAGIIDVSDNYNFNKNISSSLASKLGIRYLVSQVNIFNNSKEWKLIFSDDKVFVYENIDKPSIIRGFNQGKYTSIYDFTINGNNLTIDLKGQAYEYIDIALYDNGFWSFYNENENHSLRSEVSDMGMMRVFIDGKSNKITAQYGKFIEYFFYIFAFIGLLLHYLYLRNYEKK